MARLLPRTSPRAAFALLGRPMVIDVGLSLATRVMMIAVGMISAVITARALGTAGRGDYVYISTLGLLAVQFANIGLSTDNARRAALVPESTGIIAGNSLWASLLLGGLATAAMALYHLAHGNGAPSGQLAVLALFVPSTLYGVLVSNVLIGMGRMRAFNVYTLGTNLLQLAAIFIASTVTQEPVIVLWANAGAVFVGSALLFLTFALRSRDAVRFDFSALRSGIAFAGRVYVITLLGFAIGRTNVLMLGSLSNQQQLGIYSIAMQFGDALMLLPATVAMVLFPELVRVQSTQKTLAPTLRAAGWTAALLLPVVLLLWFIAPAMMKALFGEDFVASASVLRIMLPGLFFLGIATIFSQSLSADGVPGMQIFIWVFSGLLLLGLNFLLIPTYGSLGAAFAFACSYSVAAVGLIGLVFWRARHSRHTLLD